MEMRLCTTLSMSDSDSWMNSSTMMPSSVPRWSNKVLQLWFTSLNGFFSIATVTEAHGISKCLLDGWTVSHTFPASEFASDIFCNFPRLIIWQSRLFRAAVSQVQVKLFFFSTQLLLSLFLWTAECNTVNALKDIVIPNWTIIRFCPSLRLQTFCPPSLKTAVNTFCLKRKLH